MPPAMKRKRLTGFLFTHIPSPLRLINGSWCQKCCIVLLGLQSVHAQSASDVQCFIVSCFASLSIPPLPPSPALSPLSPSSNQKKKKIHLPPTSHLVPLHRLITRCFSDDCYKFLSCRAPSSVCYPIAVIAKSLLVRQKTARSPRMPQHSSTRAASCCLQLPPVGRFPSTITLSC